MSTIGVGVIGTGMVAQVMHLHYLAEVPGLRLTALCDLSRAQVDAVGERWHVPCDRRFTDWRELIACPDVDAVVVLTGGSHAPPAIDAARAGKHVLVEKPMCFTPREADEMIAAADRSGVTLMVGYMKAYDPTYRAAAEVWRHMHRDGEVRLIRVHDICHNNAEVVDDLYGAAIVKAQADDLSDEVKGQIARETRALWDEALGPDAPEAARAAYRKFLGLITHDTSILMLAFGQPRRLLSAEVWDAGHGLLAVLDYGGQVRCVIESARGAQHFMDESLSVYGPHQQAILEFPSPFQRNGPTVLRVAGNAGGGWFERREVSSLAEAFKLELEHFRDCVRGRCQPLTDAELGKQQVVLARDVVARAFGLPVG